MHTILRWTSASFVVINTRLRSPGSEKFHHPPSLIYAEGFHGKHSLLDLISNYYGPGGPDICD
jgi:hypothetical protein